MTVYATTNGNIFLRQGDTGNVSFSGLPEDEAYNVYMSIYNPDTESIITELLATNYEQTGTELKGVALFEFDEDFSNALPVGEWEYGLKICNDGTEDTLLPQTEINNEKIIRNAAPKFTVGNKYVEGD